VKCYVSAEKMTVEN